MKLKVTQLIFLLSGLCIASPGARAAGGYIGMPLTSHVKPKSKLDEEHVGISDSVKQFCDNRVDKFGCYSRMSQFNFSSVDDVAIQICSNIRGYTRCFYKLQENQALKYLLTENDKFYSRWGGPPPIVSLTETSPHMLHTWCQGHAFMVLARGEESGVGLKYSYHGLNPQGIVNEFFSYDNVNECVFERIALSASEADKIRDFVQDSEAELWSYSNTCIHFVQKALMAAGQDPSRIRKYWFIASLCLAWQVLRHNN